MSFAVPPAVIERLRPHGEIVVLTGAGMSAECGVPVFRGPGGLWEGHRPEELATPQAFAANPARVWRWYRWRLEAVLAAKPHAGHEALARLEGAWGATRFTLVTQNVDGMHQRAGNANVIELHGNLTRARCTAACGRTHPALSVDPRSFSCACGAGLQRPDVVWFGESLPVDSLARADRALASADQVWVVGTSSVVYPAAALPELAARRGATVIEVNPEETPLSAHVSACVRDLAAVALPAMVDLLFDSGE